MNGHSLQSIDAALDEIQNKIYEQTLEEYGPEVFKRWKEPAYMGKMDDPHATFRVTGGCGDSVEIFLKFENDKVQEALFFSDGCGPSMVCGSVACELIIGKNIDEAASLAGDDIVEVLEGGLPDDKIHCAFLAAQAVQEAIVSYQRLNPDRTDK
ncbi:iron-sulfur cluster assembly scaffold protein [Desulfonatronovibrio magnus]|uniref:iron-sulfur cluster assembly scaffold protein n=1 Tax=Desulfonatronovibrio magnus TaxID=698827 RepID=UPI0005EB2116|nr:iron-sulfur cluster assembly scaffold protein [Desulfonatronovibrio magnus]RQD56932.1 MAG: iron-sulfur cluster assembly scaffold protein [Desulfonatronovibrio sp. MSAO_Bac4]